MDAASIMHSLRGATLHRRHEHGAETYFLGETWAAATLEVQIDGQTMCCGPLLMFRIAEDAVLFDSGGLENQRWEQLQLDGDRLTVLNRGGQVVFDVIDRQP